MNAPGSWPDSTVCLPLVATVLDRGPRIPSLWWFDGPYSAKSKKKLARVTKRLLLERANVYVSLRQASEWQIRTLQGSFSRLKARRTSDKFKRQEIIGCITSVPKIWALIRLQLHSILNTSSTSILRTIDVITNTPTLAFDGIVAVGPTELHVAVPAGPVGLRVWLVAVAWMQSIVLVRVAVMLVDQYCPSLIFIRYTAILR